MVGNTCAHIYTYGGFLHITPMRYIFEMGVSLENFNQEIGFANKIFIDNTTKHNCYNNDIQKVARQATMDF